MSKSRPPVPLNTQIRAEATEWLLRFSEEEVDASGREEFSHWLRTSPEHVRAYLRIAAFWQEAGHIDGKSGPRDIEALVAQAKLEANVFPLEFGPHPGARGGVGSSVSPGRRRPLYWGVAAALLLAIGAGTSAWYAIDADPIYATNTGEQRSVNLPDGSTVTINARSRIKVAYTDAERVIELREGQALFNVAKNPARPFIVRSGTASIRAVGTQFDVYKKATGTVVTVVEGKVAVVSESTSDKGNSEAPSSLISLQRLDRKEPAKRVGEASANDTTFLIAGQRLTVSAASLRDRGPQPTPAPVKLAEATAWTAGLLVFDGAPLSEVIQEFNRQNSKPLILRDADLAGLKISGTFPASGSERILRFLEERFQVAVHETDEEIQISRP